MARGGSRLQRSLRRFSRGDGDQSFPMLRSYRSLRNDSWKHHLLPLSLQPSPASQPPSLIHEHFKIWLTVSLSLSRRQRQPTPRSGLPASLCPGWYLFFYPDLSTHSRDHGVDHYLGSWPALPNTPTFPRPLPSSRVPLPPPAVLISLLPRLDPWPGLWLTYIQAPRPT